MKMTEEIIAKIKATKEDVKIHMVTENYRVVGRRCEFTPEEKKVNKVTGEVTWEPLGHHTEFGSSIVSISKHVTRDHLDELLYVAGQLEEIKELCKKIDSK
jgi:hypothetical protein